jgi:ABC-type Mn2+/Zn2+ transport system ATPase subunit
MNERALNKRHEIQVEPHQLELDDISISYNHQTALDDLSIIIPPGCLVAVVGPNGAGKSTLFKAMVGLLPLRSGRILVHGKPLQNNLDLVAYVPQREDVDWRFPITVFDVVMMGRFGKLGWQKRPTRTDRDIVWQCIEQMGIRPLAQASISELSGGQQQRVFLARALAQEPKVFLMDEPFTGVDSSTQESTLTLIENLHQKNITVLVSTHDLKMASTRFERVLLINRRMIAYGVGDQVFTPANLQAAFGDKTLIVDGRAIVDECCPPEEHTHGRMQ